MRIEKYITISKYIDQNFRLNLEKVYKDLCPKDAMAAKEVLDLLRSREHNGLL